MGGCNDVAQDHIHVYMVTASDGNVTAPSPSAGRGCIQSGRNLYLIGLIDVGYYRACAHDHIAVWWGETLWDMLLV